MPSVPAITSAIRRGATYVRDRRAALQELGLLAVSAPFGCWSIGRGDVLEVPFVFVHRPDGLSGHNRDFEYLTDGQVTVDPL